MMITLLISDPMHPINKALSGWVKQRSSDFSVSIIRNSDEAEGGDICFLISCTEILKESFIRQYRHVLVVHASDLPLGRGWSPHIWQILNGETKIVVSLLEAATKVDSGDIWKKLSVEIPKYFLYDEIMDTLSEAHIKLIEFAVENFGKIRPVRQRTDIKPTYFQRRSPADSEVSPLKTIQEQFNLLRVCDPHRFPAFFHVEGKKFKITLERCNEE